MRVLVCGGRDYNDQFAVSDALDRLYGASPSPKDFSVIQGAAKGADRLAVNWCRERYVTCHHFPANWRELGPAAGPIRNVQMLREGRPDLVLAFPGGKGTANMVSLAEDAGIPVVRPALRPSLPSTLTGGV